jgi:uncharacterized protein
MALRERVHGLRDAIHAAAESGAGDVRLFGSVARGDERPESDVDLLVTLEPGRTYSILLGSNCDWSVYSACRSTW